MATDTSDGDLWKEALDCISEEDRDQIKEDMVNKSLQSLRDATEAERKKCEGKKLVVYKHKGGRNVTLHDILEKIASVADSFKEVGTKSVGFDPTGKAAAPWAVVQVLITGAVASINTFKQIGESFDRVSDTISRFSVVEKLYLVKGLKTTGPLRGKMLILYGHILTYLAACRRYYTAGTGGRLFRDLHNAVTSRYADLESAMSEDEVNRWISLADADLKEAKDEAVIERYNILKRLLDDVQEYSKRLLRELENKTGKILQWMSTINYEAQHNLVMEAVQPNTCLWLLESSEFSGWKGSDSSSVFWLDGPAGTGKTSIVSAVIQHLQEKYPTHSTCPIAYFYCSRDKDEPSRRCPREIMGCILKQLASSSDVNDPVQKLALDEYEHRSKNLLAGQTARKLSASASTRLCIDLCKKHPAYIIVDALDECGQTERQEIVEKLERLVQESEKTVRVFISSRSHIDMPSLFDYATPIRTTITSAKNQNDIFQFVDFMVNDRQNRKLLLDGRLSTHTKKKTTKILKKGAQGMFRWVVLSLKYLQECEDIEDYKQRLKEVPPKCFDLYDITHKEITESGPAALRSIKCVFSLLRTRDYQLRTGVVASAVVSVGGSDLGGNSNRAGPSPRTTRTPSFHDTFTAEGAQQLSEMSRTSDMDEDPESYSLQRKTQQIICLCRSFVLLDTKNDAFSFSHPSVREYLFNQSLYRQDRTHARLARLCIRVLRHEDDPELSGSETYKSKLHFFAYAVCNWERHSRRVFTTPADDDSFRTVLFQFLFQRTDSFQDNIAQRLQDFRSLEPKISDSEIESTERGVFDLGTISSEVLHSASRMNSTAVIDEAIARGCKKLDEPNWEGQTALYIATVRGHISAAKRLLELGANPAVESRHVANSQLGNFSPLVGALYHQEHTMALQLMSVTEIDLNDDLLIVRIASYGDEAVVKALLKHRGLDPDALRRGNTLLAESIRHRNTSGMKVLLDDTRVDKKLPCVLQAIATTDWKRSPYITSGLPSSKDVFEAFFNHSCVDLNSQDGGGFTALHHAVKRQSEELVMFLLSNQKTNVYLLDKSGNRPLQIAIKCGYGKILQLLEQHERESPDERGRQVVDGRKGQQS